MDLSALRRMTADLPALIGRAQEFAERAATEEYEATSPEGEVTVWVSGGKALLHIRISADAKRRVDNVTLGELVADTVRAAEQAADDAREEFLRSVWIGDHSVADFLRDPASFTPRPPTLDGLR